MSPTRLTLRVALVVATFVGSTGLCGAQTDTGRGIPPAGRGRAGGRLGAPVRPGLGVRKEALAAQDHPLDPAERQAAIRLVRQAMNRAYRRQLNLNDGQMRTLQKTEQRYERQRADLLKSERETRKGLRAAMLDTTGTRDQAKIAAYLDQLTQAQRKRADLLEAEQKDLSTFLTPMQRAQYLGLKERLDQRILQLRQQSAPPAAKGDSIPPG